MFDTIHDWVQWLGNNAALYLLPFLLVISVLVFVHEWGHYIIARACGVKVETFSIGFGKKICGWTDKSGTHWQVALIPLGGYVKMFGDTDPASATFTESVKEGETTRAMNEGERSQAFFAKPVWKRAAIVFAGPAINFIFAIIILTGMYTTIGRVVTPPVAGAIIVGSAAEKAGFQPLDRILSIDGKPVHRFADIQRTVAVSLAAPLSIDVERDGKVVTIPDVSPRVDIVSDRFGFKHARGLLGIIGPGLGVSVDGIEAVDGKKGDVGALLTRRMDRQVVLSMKAQQGAPAQDIMVKLSRDLNGDFLKGAANKDGIKAIQLAPRLENEPAPLSLFASFRESLADVWFVSTGTLQSLGQMIIGTRSVQELGGIIRIGAVAGDAAQQGFLALLTLAAMLSVNLGLINLMPIPMLDGGHLLFYAIEAVKGRPIPEKVQEAALRFGFFLLIGLMLFANLNDVFQLAK